MVFPRMRRGPNLVPLPVLVFEREMASKNPRSKRLVGPLRLSKRRTSPAALPNLEWRAFQKLESPSLCD